MVKRKKEESLKEAEKEEELGKDEALHARAESNLSIKELKIDGSKSSVLSGYDATDDSDIVFK
jgi:hypothetical protein